MPRNIALLDRWFNGTLPTQKANRLFELMRKDDKLRAEYNRRSAIERLLIGHENIAGPLTHFQVERLEEHILSQTSTEVPRTPKVSILRWRLAPVAATLVLLLALPVALLLMDKTSQDEVSIPKSLFAPRGVSAPYKSHVFLFCVSDESEQIAFHRLDRPPMMADGMDSCRINNEFQFAVTNLTDEHNFVYIFGIDENNKRLWYFPKPGEGRSRRLPSGISEHLLGDSILLNVNHRPGVIRVFAIFSDEPVRDDEADLIWKRLKSYPTQQTMTINEKKIRVESFPLRLEAGGATP